MAVTNGPQIRLRADIGAEVGLGSSSNVNMNNATIRSLIGKGSGVQTSMSEYYGASSAPTLVGTGSRVEAGFTYGFNSNNRIDLTGAGIQVGDFVVIGLTSDNTIRKFNYWNGMSGLKRYDGGDASANPISLNSAVSSPGWEVVSGEWQSGDSNPYITPITYDGNPITLCFAIFRNVNGRQQHEVAQNSANSSPNPPQVNAVSGNTSIIICVGHLDDRNINMAAPSGYTLAVARGGTTTRSASTAIAYKITTDNGAHDPGAFNVFGNWDSWAASTIRA